MENTEQLFDRMMNQNITEMVPVAAKLNISIEDLKTCARFQFVVLYRNIKNGKKYDDVDFIKDLNKLEGVSELAKLWTASKTSLTANVIQKIVLYERLTDLF